MSANPTKFVHYFHITGFGRFANIDINPAMLTIGGLDGYLAKIEHRTTPQSHATGIANASSNSPSNPSSLSISTSKTLTTLMNNIIANTNSPLSPDTSQTREIEVYYNTSILQVDVKTVEDYFIAKFHEIPAINDQFQSHNSQNVSLFHHFIHVGVSGGIRHIAMEEFAYNNATFRIPDEAGYQPLLQPIRQLVRSTTSGLCDLKCDESGETEQQGNDQQPVETDGNTATCRLVCPSMNKPDSSPQTQTPNASPHDVFALPQSTFFTQQLDKCASSDATKMIEFDHILQTPLDLNTLHPFVLQHAPLFNPSLQPESNSTPTLPESRFFTSSPTKCGQKTHTVSKQSHSPCVPKILITNDPGAFICNYTYYISLFYTKFVFPFISTPHSTSSSPSTMTKVVTHYTSLFYHVPLEHSSPIINNQSILLATMLGCVVAPLSPSSPVSSATTTQTQHSTQGFENKNDDDEQTTATLPLAPTHSFSTLQSSPQTHDPTPQPTWFKTKKYQVAFSSPICQHVTPQSNRLPRAETLDPLEANYNLSTSHKSKSKSKSDMKTIIAQFSKDIAAFADDDQE